MRYLSVAGMVLALALAGCLAPAAETTARNWRPMGAGGLNLGQLLAVSPGLRQTTWESYDGPTGDTLVRVAVEYDPARTASGCPLPGVGSQRADRTFLLLTLSVAGSGTVDFVSAEARAYSEGGAYAATPLDIGVIADLTTRVSPLPCTALVVPAAL